ncbi:MAG: hypothetical protein H6698_08805 [Myxococcales bacterium]|nr:hypothetical protein [Myxococcales bacterium]MCB9534384.1 hypothetical protein [Myxococcales bacterium]
MQTATIERRKLRTSNSNRALGFLFTAVAESYTLSLVALADARGLLLVHWGDAQQADVLAAYGPLLVRTVDPASRAHILDTLAATVPSATPARLSVRRVACHGEDLYLCVVGEPGAAKDVALNRAISGTRRILA